MATAAGVPRPRLPGRTRRDVEGARLPAAAPYASAGGAPAIPAPTSRTSMRTDQVIRLIDSVLGELEGDGFRLPEADAGLLRRQRQAVLLERATAELMTSSPLPGFRSRLAWRLPSRAAAPPDAVREEDLAARACRAARRLWRAAGLSRSARGLDALLMRQIPGANGDEIRRTALGTGRPADAVADAPRSPAARLLAALAVIAVTLRQAGRDGSIGV